MEIRDRAMRMRTVKGRGSGIEYKIRDPSPMWFVKKSEDEPDERVQERVFAKCILSPCVVEKDPKEGEIVLEDICQEDYYQLFEELILPSIRYHEQSQFFRKLGAARGPRGAKVRREAE